MGKIGMKWVFQMAPSCLAPQCQWLMDSIICGFVADCGIPHEMLAAGLGMVLQ